MEGDRLDVFGRFVADIAPAARIRPGVDRVVLDRRDLPAVVLEHVGVLEDAAFPVGAVAVIARERDQAPASVCTGAVRIQVDDA